ncbi:MAG: DNA internalization-related competence protein ComEC/Rec2 [Candidatus Reconcilbacillus cellulovorans]|uniref:DNA internalization-related competence protein ComEC/Rec2 n=1 Tax=Candidatus Reconcilbacillus cellulovorans TaxID=1906605 RepID=A0A2A6DZ34_9BACL|nr:MAG: DNA internalization-related competence protein ComEC/Rec2 [Candidatus Reconcilbacillus cellulovorans]
MSGRPLVAAAVAWTAAAAIALEVESWSAVWKIVAIVAGIAVGLTAISAIGVNGPVASFARFGPTCRRTAITVGIGCMALVYTAWIHLRNESSIPPAENGHPIRLVGTIAAPAVVDGDRARVDVRTATGEKLRASFRLSAQSEQEEVRSWRRGWTIELDGRLSRPDPARNEGGFDYRRYLKSKRIHWIVEAEGLGGIRIDPTPGSASDRLLRSFDLLREHLAGRIDRLYPDAREAGFLKAFLLGVRDGLDPEQNRQFSELGLTHVLAISGLHVAVFTVAVAGTLRLAGLTRETAFGLTAAAVPFYVTLVGAAPSVVRAGLMAMIGLLLAYRNFPKDGMNVLAAALIAMLIWDPYWLWDVGFQLSFLVTAGLIAVVPKIVGRTEASWGRRLANAALGTVVATVTAQAVSFPIVIYYFNQFSLLSVPVNIVVAPVFSFWTLPASTLSLAADAVHPATGRAIALAVSAVDRALFVAVEWAAEWGKTWLTVWPSPHAWWTAFYFVWLAFVVRTAKAGAERRNFDRLTAAVLALVGISLLSVAYFPPNSIGGFRGEVRFLDVGQGDAVLIRTPGGKAVLVDGGGSFSTAGAQEEWRKRRDPFEIGRDVVVPLLKKRGVRSLDLVAATHLELDHIGGLASVVEDIPVSALLFNATWKESEPAERLFRAALGRGVPVYAAESGTVWRIDPYTSLALLDAGFDGKTVDGLPAENRGQNRHSLVLLLTMRDVRFLLTGDIGAQEEAELLSSPHVLGALAAGGVDVLKIAHHGSRGSTSAAWLDAWRPADAVISVGRRNPYGHPHPDVLSRLAERGIRIWRTDLHGEIAVFVGPGRYTVRTTIADSPAGT